MKTRKSATHRYGIAAITSFYSALVTLLILGGACVLFYHHESKLVSSIIDAYMTKANGLIETQSQEKRSVFERMVAIQNRIAASMSASFLYNLDVHGLTHSLMPLMEMEQIRGIEAKGEAGEPFCALWKTDTIMTGAAIPDGLRPDEGLSFQTPVRYRDQFMGTVRIYYTDAQFVEQLKNDKAATKEEIDALRAEVDHEISKSMLRQIGGVGVIVAILVATNIVCLRITAIRPLKWIISELRTDARTLHHAGRRMADRSAILADNAARQAGAVQEASTSLEEIAASSHQTFQLTTGAEALMRDNLEKSRKALALLADLSNRMSRIAADGQRMERIMATVDDIAFQTHLLALNAAVEAARAGESGHGFTVVAEEVRHLARRAAEAARETQELLGHTIRQMGESADAIQQMNRDFEGIVASASEMGEKTDVISRASREQSRLIGTINSAAGEIDQMTQQMAVIADEAAEAAAAMNDQVGGLKAIVQGLSVIIRGEGGARPVEGAALPERKGEEA